MINTKEKATVKDFKVSISAVFGKPVEQLCLIFVGKILKDHETLADHGIVEGKVINLAINEEEDDDDDEAGGDAMDVAGGENDDGNSTLPSLSSPSSPTRRSSLSPSSSPTRRRQQQQQQQSSSGAGQQQRQQPLSASGGESAEPTVNIFLCTGFLSEGRARLRAFP